MKTRAAVLYGTGQELKVEELDLEPPRAGEVLIDMKAAGVCHSDYHVVTGDAPHAMPVVLGHEGAGVVATVGDGVTSVGEGDHVCLSWIPSCGTCRLCRGGRPQLCRTYQGPLWAGTMFDGTHRLKKNGTPIHHLSSLACWADHAVVPEASCVRTDRELPMSVAAVIGCAVTTGVGAVINRAKVEPGSSVVVYGGGGVGLSVVMGAKLAGASRIIVVDKADAKASIASTFGATDFVRGGPDALERILEITDGIGADYVFEAVGNTVLESNLIDTIGPGGMAVMLGFPGSGSTFDVDPAKVIRDEKTLTGAIFGSAHTERDFVKFGRLYLDGQLPIDQLITSTYPLEQVNRACSDMLTGESGRGVLVFD